MAKQKTTEELQSELDALSKDNAVKVKEITTLTESVDALKKEVAELQSANNSLKELNEELADKVSNLVTENSDQTEIIEDLRSQLSTANATSTGKVVVEHEGKKYTVEAPTFKYQGNVYKDSDLQGNKDLVKELIDKKIGFLAEI